VRKNSQLLDAGLRDEHPIDRIAMYNRQTARRQGVAKADRQGLETIPCNRRFETIQLDFDPS
jgi:hypothetical protein